MFPTFESYRAGWQSAYTTDPKIPLNLDIELASVCNLACPFCFYGEADWNAEMQKNAADGKPKKRFMSTLLAKILIDQASKLGVPALKFNWRGESTLHPDYATILKYAANKKTFHEILVNTNANCKDAAVEGLMCATKVMVSLDSTIPEIYKKMRVNGDLERALEVIQKLIDLGHENLWVRRVIAKENWDEPFAKNVNDIFHGRVKISEHHCFDRNADEHHQLNDSRLERTYCGYPSQRLMIASDGTAYPCCVDYDGSMPVGHFPEQSILDIWTGAKMVDLRAELRANNFKSKSCKNCTSWMSYKAPQRDSVQDKDISNG